MPDGWPEQGRFVYHEPPLLIDLNRERRRCGWRSVELRAALATIYAASYEPYVQGNGISAQCRTGALQLRVASLRLSYFLRCVWQASPTVDVLYTPIISFGSRKRGVKTGYIVKVKQCLNF